MLGVNKHLLMISSVEDYDNAFVKVSERISHHKKGYKIERIAEWDDYYKEHYFGDQQLSDLLIDYVYNAEYTYPTALFVAINRYISINRYITKSEMKSLLKEHGVPKEFHAHFICKNVPSKPVDNNTIKEARIKTIAVKRSFSHFINNTVIYGCEMTYGATPSAVVSRVVVDHGVAQIYHSTNSAWTLSEDVDYEFRKIYGPKVVTLHSLTK